MFNRSWFDRILLAATKAHCRRVLRRFYAATKQAAQVQERVLLDKIRRNADSDFGRSHGFDQIRSYADFKRHLPIRSYEDFEPYIARLRRGEHSAMFGGGQKVRMFALTSGTTGKPKYIPVTDQFLKEFRNGWNAFGIKSLMDHEDAFLRPIVQITSRMDESFTEAGIPCGAITGLMAAKQKHLVRKYYLTPACVAHIDDALARYYTIMRLSVPAENVGFMVTANPATPLRLVKTAAEHAEQLIRDIHDGTLWPALEVPEAVRKELRPRFKPNPQRARQLQQVIDQHGALLPKHYWKLGFLCNWTGGTLGLFMKEFPKYFGDTPVRDIGLQASEGRMSIPVEDGTAAGILEVESNFYEFIPTDQIDRPDPDCLRCHEVEVGQEYFILLTNSAGLYRYSIGDQIRVVGFEGQAPLIEFLNKGDHICSLAGEKLTEHQVVTAVQQAVSATGSSVGNYVLSPQWDDPPYYRLLVEMTANAPKATLAAFREVVDRKLGELNLEYRSKLKSLRLGRLRIAQLPAGYLERRDRVLSTKHRRNNEQFKHKFLLTQPGEDSDFPILKVETDKRVRQTGGPPSVKVPA